MKQIRDNVFAMDHPLIEHKITIMRDKNLPPKDFRELVAEVALLMGYEITRDLETKEVEVETPIAPAKGNLIKRQVAIVPILRAGLGFSDALVKLIPAAKTGHIGLYRDPVTSEPVKYYCKLPSELDQRTVLVTDPMLATGGSAVAAIDFLKQDGAKKIKFMCLIAAPEGVERLTKAHPDVEIYIGALDEKLNEKNYIVPGLGDAGDRLFGTL